MRFQSKKHGGGEMIQDSELGLKVLQARRVKGMSQTELARLLGFGYAAHITRLERGRAIPVKMASKICKALGVSF